MAIKHTETHHQRTKRLIQYDKRTDVICEQPLTKAFQEVLVDLSKASILSTAGGSSEGDAWRGHAGLAGPVNLKLSPDSTK